MMQIILLFFILFSHALFSNNPISLAVTESLPSALVAGSVNAITGDHYCAEDDIIIQGAFPLKIPRSYISGKGNKTFLGWQLFPHLFAGLYLEYRNDTAYWVMVVKEPNGSTLEFETTTYIPKKKNNIILNLKTDTTRKGLTNVGRGVISAQTNLKNIRVEMSYDKKSMTAYAPDGSVRYYKQITVKEGEGAATDYLERPRNCTAVYLLQTEQLPNHSKICYGHDKYHRVNVIRTTTQDMHKTFASANIHYHSDNLNKNRNFDINTSDGRTLNYRFEAHSGIFSLKNVSTPAYPHEAMTYHDKVKVLGTAWGYLLKHRNVSNDRCYNLNYYWEGKNDVGKNKIKISTDDPRWLRVKTLSRPVGEDNTPLITHSFIYDTGNRVTNVRSIDNTLTQYRYSENFRIEQILYYGPGDQLHHSEKYVWGNEGSLAANLLCHTFLDHQNNPIFSERYSYDNRGNVQEEIFYGNLSGACTAPLVLGKDGFPKHNGIESYTIKRSYSQDGLNLLLREERQNGKVTLSHYHPNTSVLVARFICDHDQIKIRNFFDYNGDFLLIREISDDGCSSDKNSLSGVKTRHIKEYNLIPDGQPYQGMPQTTTEKYWDGSSEKLLGRKVLHYTTGGCIHREDIYDSNNKHCLSKTAKYDLAGRVKEETNAIGQIAIHDHDAVGNKNYYKDFSGRKEFRMDYDCSNRLKVVHEIGDDQLFRKTTHRYDTKHNKIATQDPYGNTTMFIPDTFGQVVQINHPQMASPTGTSISPIEKFGFDSAGRLERSIDARGHEISKRFNARNQVISIAYPDGGSERFVYNLDGTLAYQTNQENSTTTYSYDFLGRITSETNALGHTTTYTYDAFNLINIVDAEGNTTTYTYDGAGRKISEELAGEIIEYSYDPLNRLYCTKKGEACHITEYDNLDRVTEERDEDSEHNIYKKISYKYDEAGNLSQITRFINGREAHETFAYDSFNRLIQHTDALGYITTTTYDDRYQNHQGQNVLQITETDPFGLQIITTYDALGHVASAQKNSPKNGIQDVEEHFYDENGNIALHIKNHNHTVSWKYDPMNRVETLMEGSTRSTHYDYTKTGLVRSKRKPDGVLLTSQYDPLDQLKEIASSDRSIRYTFNYNRIGQQILEKDEINGTQTLRQYDPHGRLLGEKLGNGLALSSEYDPQGRKNRFIVPDGSDVIYQYDPIFLRKIIRNNRTHSFDVYDLSGRHLKQTLAGSLGEIAFSYDLVGRKTMQQSAFNTQEAIYDRVGNLSELRTNRESKQYDYDDLYRLTLEHDHAYKYDQSGNRTDKNGEEFRYNDINEIVSHQTHDPNGNPKTDEDKSYTYDALDRLIAVSSPEGTIKYRYDYQGRLLTKAVNENATFYLYDGMKEIGAADATGSIFEYRILNPTCHSERGAAVLLEINQQSYVPIHDLFGNLTELYDMQGHLIESYKYSSYGEGLQEGINPWQYASKRLHHDTGLISFGLRFYSPKYGRWLTPDPAGFADGYNVYSFVANNPLTNFDHYGLMTTPIISLPPTMADIEQNAKDAAPILTPIMHGIADAAISTGNFLADTGFIIASPWMLYQNNFEWQGVAREWNTLQRDFAQFHQSLDRSMQQVVPSAERGQYYNWSRSTTEAAIGGYYLAQAAGPALTRGISWVTQSARSASRVAAAESEVRGAATNRAKFEQYKTKLRAEMEKPHVTNLELQKTVNDVYKPNARVGSGSTAAAIREERKTGEPVFGRMHSKKGLDSINSLEKWLRNNPTASHGDRAAAENIIKDLKNALE